MLFLGYTSKLLPDGTEWRGGNKRRQHVEGPYPCKALLQQAITERILPGNNKAERLSSLWKRLKEFYKRVRPASVLDNLTEEMIRRDGASKKPKLKAKGAERRYLIPFGVELANFLAEQKPTVYMRTVKDLFVLMNKLQQRVSCTDMPFDPTDAGQDCRRFCTLYQSLEEHSQFPFWHMKPKTHLLQEMLEYSSEVHGNPRDYWCYRDESWCGFSAKATKRRGGANTSTNARNFLQRYLAAEALK